MSATAGDHDDGRRLERIEDSFELLDDRRHPQIDDGVGSALSASTSRSRDDGAPL
jgi:hypothetical protein